MPLKTRSFSIVLLLGSIAVFGYGLVRLFALRFEAGDIYPAYSSLRSDPLGTRALFESLENLPAMIARRNYQSISKLREEEPATLFLFGVPPRELRYPQPEQEIREAENFVVPGGRLVITLLPTTLQRLESTNQLRRARTEPDKPPVHRVSLSERWGFKLATHKTNETGSAASPWHSALHFDALDKPWRVLAREAEHPVLIERNLGKGSIVLAADSFFVSNEALRRARHSELLTSLIGPHRVVVFDETHLGVREEPGLMTLARRYRLRGLLAGLSVLAALFVWQNAFSFVPAADRHLDETMEISSGRDAASGFVSLLRRSIIPSKLIAVCVQEWKQSFAHRKDYAGRVAQIEELARAGGKDAAEHYRQIAEELAKKGIRP
jgi:hypothetical protein